MAKESGMKYICFTTKHHDGFCMWDTKYSDYNIMNTPYGKDVLKMLADACHKHGMLLSLYYSNPDWHHEYGYNPASSHQWRSVQTEKVNTEIYREYIKNQVTELLTNYGKIDILWFDFSFDPARAFPQFKGKGKDDWESEKLIALARELQPGIMIDNRADIEQDINTPEQYQVDEWPRHKETGELLTWEACQTFSGSWGYYRDEMTWKSPEMLVEMLCKTVSLGGNLLMNVGPCARGYFDRRATDSLDAFGNWMKYNSRSIYGCTMAEPEFTAPRGTVLTQSEDGKRLYIHILSYPFSSLSMENLDGKIEYAQFLHDASEIKYTQGKPAQLFGDHPKEVSRLTFFSLPVVKPDVLVPVIEILLK